MKPEAKNLLTKNLLILFYNLLKMEKKFIINLQWKDFITFEWLLDAFHANWWTSIKTQIVSNDPFIIQATVEWKKGIYQWIWDANTENVNSQIVKHKFRMAETRAIARALRWYNNIWMCSADEIWEDTELKKRESPINTPQKLKKEIQRVEQARLELESLWKNNCDWCKKEITEDVYKYCKTPNQKWFMPFNDWDILCKECQKTYWSNLKKK